MEQTNSEENLKSPTEEVENFSPTGQYQYEEAKNTEPDAPVTQIVSDFRPEDEIIIQDETNELLPREDQEPQENLIEEVIREVPPEDIAVENQEPNELRPENNANGGERNVDAEFYQHSLQHLVQNLNNLRDTLQTILTNTDLAQELGQNNPNNNAPNPPAHQVPNEGLNNEGQFHDQLLNLRRMLGGGNPPPNNNLNNNLFEGLRNVENNNQRANQNSLFSSLENYGRHFVRIVSKDVNAVFWVIFGFSLVLFLSSLSNIPDLHRRSPDYFIEWLAFHKSSSVFLLSLMMIYMGIVVKFCQILFNSFTAEPGENFYKTLFSK